MFTQASYSVEDLLAFRKGIYTAGLTARADALFELSDALLTTPRPSSVVALSLAPAFRRQWSSVFDALSDGRMDRDAIRRHQLAFAPSDARPVWVVDHTLWSRPDARTSPDRGFYHQPTRVWGQKPIGIGHAYTTVGIVPEEEGSWFLPLDQRRISTEQTPVEAAAVQIKELLEEVSYRPLVEGDSEYGCGRFVNALGDAACDVLLRIRPNRVLYGEPGPYDGRGRPRKHGARFALSDDETWSEPDAVWEGKDADGNRMIVRVWEQVHFKQAANFPGTVILIEWPDAKGTRRDPRRLWLFWRGQDRPELPQSAPLYGRRFTVEHFYRFEKQTFRWNKAQMPDLEPCQRWTDLMGIAYWQLWVARPLVQDVRLPWDRKPRKRLTPGQVHRVIGGLLAGIGTPARVPKPRGKSPGRRPGDKPAPRPRCPVVKKGKKRGKKGAKDTA